MLEAVLRCAGYRTGLYMSPHLLRYNERVRIGGEPQDDAALLAAFNAVEDARVEVPLTYFEYGTLAAFHAFARRRARRRDPRGGAGRAARRGERRRLPTSRW